MIKIRLARGGRKGHPIYTIVASDVRSPRNGKFIEKLGQYDPKCPKGEVVKNLQSEKIVNWVKMGAKCSETVKSLLKKEKIQLS